MLSKYLKKHRDIYLTAVLVMALFGIVFYAFNIGFEIYLYSCLIIVVFLVIALKLKMNKTKKNVEKIRAYMRNINSNLDIDDVEIEEAVSEMKRINREYLTQMSELDKNNEEFKRFITTWMHQIKTPIAAINLQLEGDIDKFELKNNIFSVEEYLNLLLNYLRYNSKTTDYVFKKVNLDKLIREVIRKYAPLFIKKGIRIEYQPRELEIVTDYKWLMFAIEQILSNSLKYTSEGKVTIEIRDGSISIKDTGIGIAPEDIKRVTELGYTGYNGRIYSKSTGIGLYLTNEILKNLNLDLKIESESGTEVSICFK
ncbi:Signal transduction histidine kinase [Peptoniphilus asaccharolyticus DSM 20463]|uniref:histidine kinase n=2 Tax=Peptoniphilus asaccharolyticus TaxID=1258 RepID=A0A1W1V4A4_PEPAS|nr:sensor histidine kinase [Peptoniphilus asaccharolyticus]SMB87841.1 Signal transduction histidine kinase [Peptoniphilus asaccharolyticus DSM 20463]